MLADANVAQDVESWVAEVEAATVAALEELGEATANELTKRVEGLRVKPASAGGRARSGPGRSVRRVDADAVPRFPGLKGRVIRGPARDRGC